MSLDLAHIIQQVQQFGEATYERLARRQKQLPALIQDYTLLGQMDPKDLMDRLARAPEGWSGALPTHDAPTAQFPPPKPPAQIDVLAADGSQVYPDRHSPILYYLINIGAILMPYGSQRPPETTCQPALYYDPEDIYDAGHLISPAIVNGQRDVAELTELAALAEKPSQRHSLALLDNSLLLRLASGDRANINKTVHRLINQFVDSLTRLQQSAVNLAGFIDRPGRTDLLNTISLVNSSKSHNAYSGLVDRDLMTEWLKPTHRTAVFRWGTTDFPELSQAGHALHFFYLHMRRPGVIARVEIPQWVAENNARVEQVHAGILWDSRSTGGYPYSLIRAHELAVITQRERQALEQWLLKNLVDHGLTLEPSQKAVTKAWLGRSRRHNV
ncbi:MAG: DNA double-strand break repair nuclease NurA [Anaerolineales bacterium]|jgi:hypothetical protein